MPLGFWLQDLLEFTRNPCDRIGHFAQGFVPAIVARELLLRHTPLRRGGGLFTIVAGMCLAISAQLLLAGVHDRALAQLGVAAKKSASTWPS